MFYFIFIREVVEVEKQRKKEREAARAPIHWFMPPECLQGPRQGQVAGNQSRSEGANHLGHHCCLPGFALAGS